MAKAPVAPVSSKGQVTLPKPIRDLLHVADGDYVQFKPSAHGILITKVKMETEAFSETEWKTLERLSSQRGRRYTTAKEFLKDLERS